MASYDEQTAKLERFDKRIGELASQSSYEEKAKRLGCFLGIKTHTALSLLVETGDLSRFAKGSTYAAFLGLAPGENSSGETINRRGITKAGNRHLGQLLIEAARGICKGAGMLCVGDDDRQYGDENGRKEQQGQLSVKGALHRWRGRPMTAICPCCRG